MIREAKRQLNDRQQAVVNYGSGPLLIVAGAGTGKTTVLISRLAHLILDQKLGTDQVLLLTFTEKSAGELEERADKLLPYGYIDLWIHTFHGFCERILRDHALDIGLPTDFRLVSDTEQWILIKNNLDRFALDYYRPLGNPTKFIAELLRHFSRLKDENISPADYRQAIEASPDEDEAEQKRLLELVGAYETYNQLLLENNYLDFGDLIVYALRLFRTRKNICQHYQKQFRYIMVDEFQDTNFAQYELVKLLAAPDNNLTVVGDDDQSIYKFRGASLSNILQFKDDYPQAEEIVLIDNYRSRQEILDHAYSLIKHNNPDRLEEKLHIDKQLVARADFLPAESPAIQYLQFDRGEDEVSFVGSQIGELYRSGRAAWSDCAILVRANDTAEAYVKELTRLGIPNEFVSLRGLYYKPIILDCLAYLRLLDNYHESSALFRVLNMPAFKVDYLDLITINKMAKRKVWSLYEALKNIALISGVTATTREHITKLLSLITKHSLLIATSSPSQIFLRFVYDSGLVSDYDFDKDQETFSYLNQFYQKIKKFEDNLPAAHLADFMQLMDLELEAGETGSLRLDFSDNDVVRIMTVHAAKGLEFKYVFLVNIVDKKFPTISRTEKISLPDHLVKEPVVGGKESHLEEERRLFYVAVTRAKEQLLITGAKDYGGAREKKPSPFIAELDLEITSALVDPEYYNQPELKRDLDRLDNPIKRPLVKLAIPDKFSFSQLAAFSNCPLQYKFAFILRIPAPSDKASLIFGRVLHNVLHDFLAPLESGGRAFQPGLFVSESKAELTENELFNLYQSHWQEDGYDTKEERAKYYRRGREILAQFWSDWQKETPQEIIFLEKNFTFKIAGGLIKGAIDRVDRLADGSLEIIDYKTGRPKDKLVYADKRQLILYKIALEELFGAKVSLLSYYYLEGTYKTSFTPSDKEVTKLQAEIAEEISRIRQGEFPPQPSELCHYCDFRNICQWKMK